MDFRYFFLSLNMLLQVKLLHRMLQIELTCILGLFGFILGEAGKFLGGICMIPNL